MDKLDKVKQSIINLLISLAFVGLILLDHYLNDPGYTKVLEIVAALAIAYYAWHSGYERGLKQGKDQPPAPPDSTDDDDDDSPLGIDDPEVQTDSWKQRRQPILPRKPKASE